MADGGCPGTRNPAPWELLSSVLVRAQRPGEHIDFRSPPPPLRNDTFERGEIGGERLFSRSPGEHIDVKSGDPPPLRNGLLCIVFQPLHDMPWVKMDRITGL
jgi:hypothetical protein